MILATRRAFVALKLTIEFSAALVVEYPPEKSELFGPLSPREGLRILPTLITKCLKFTLLDQY